MAAWLVLRSRPIFSKLDQVGRSLDCWCHLYWGFGVVLAEDMEVLSVEERLGLLLTGIGKVTVERQYEQQIQNPPSSPQKWTCRC